MTPKPLERDIERAIRKYAEDRHCLFEKFVSPAKRGVADRVIIAPGGVVGWLEVKRPGAKPTVLQMERLREKQEKGCEATWCDNVADGCRFVDSLIAAGKLSTPLTYAPAYQNRIPRLPEIPSTRHA